MGKPVLPIEYRFTQTEIDSGAANTLSGVRIVVIGANNQPTGVVYESGASGAAPVVSSAGIKNNLAATVAPTATDDSGAGYAVGSRWIDTTADESYICVDSTAGSAVWSKSTVGTIAEVSGLQGALDVKAPLASPAFTGTPTGITKTHVGLGNADNTADTAKPVSTAQQTALDLKADNTDLTDSSINARFRTYLGSAVQFMASGTDLNTLAGVGWYNIQNPVNGPTTTTWYYVENIIHRTTSGEAVDSNYKFQRAITLTDTGVKEYSRISIANSWTAWVEIANIGDLATYAPLASPALTGTPTAPTATAGTNTTQLATTAFAMAAVAGRLTHISQGTLDANNTALTDNAVYTSTNTAVMTNAPTTAWAWALFNFRMGNWRTQIWIPAGGNIIYKRTVDGTFTGAVWQSVTFA